jgi:hypothetical protein
MKKISLFALTLTTGMALFAQENVNRTAMAVKPYFGIKGGVNLAKLRPDNYTTMEPSTNLKTTAHAGVAFNLPLNTTGTFAVQPELLYSRQGSKMKTTTTIGTVTTTNAYEQDLHYIALPIMLQAKTLGGFFVETGPQAAYLINAKQEGPGNNNETDNKDSFDHFDLSWGLGVGYMTRMGLGIGARYNHGLTNTFEEGDADDGPELKNSVINIGLTWFFGAGK